MSSRFCIKFILCTVVGACMYTLLLGFNIIKRAFYLSFLYTTALWFRFLFLIDLLCSLSMAFLSQISVSFFLF